jgi:hypothetical protein
MLEAELQQRAQLRHTQEILKGAGQAARYTAVAVRQARLGLRVAQLVGTAAKWGGALRQQINIAASQNLAAPKKQI